MTVPVSLPVGCVPMSGPRLSAVLAMWDSLSASDQGEFLDLIGAVRVEDRADAAAAAGDVGAAFQVYNDAAARTGWPRVQRLSDVRKRALRARLRECGGLDGWRHAVARAEASDFLCGRGRRAWTAFGFDWLVKPANFTKVMEGNYDNRTGPGDPGSVPDTLFGVLDVAGRSRPASSPDWL